ncbi:hypothetical protein I7I53_06377 [Histoplasma capsulatum var. duboisii H88]|uniref:Uncharacterized protein n=1 Tax=Ajellomyces capsulatus (strain H88) TaxID=544711 RepID=A0A8A1LB05_AJEC8|nr:hypothetical protein I7I53_06377 [Histoplasma capsulatum var. duboisii H88]
MKKRIHTGFHVCCLFCAFSISYLTFKNLTGKSATIAPPKRSFGENVAIAFPKIFISIRFDSPSLISISLFRSCFWMQYKLRAFLLLFWRGRVRINMALTEQLRAGSKVDYQRILY